MFLGILKEVWRFEVYTQILVIIHRQLIVLIKQQQKYIEEKYKF